MHDRLGRRFRLRDFEILDQSGTPGQEVETLQTPGIPDDISVGTGLTLHEGQLFSRQPGLEIVAHHVFAKVIAIATKRRADDGPQCNQSTQEVIGRRSRISSSDSMSGKCSFSGISRRRRIASEAALRSGGVMRGRALDHHAPVVRMELQALAASGNCAARCLRAAFTNPANNGWPSRGVEVNSGWNCVATNHGCPGSSMISTRSSFDRPRETGTPPACNDPCSGC